jgi:hypothetical protein
MPCIESRPNCLEVEIMNETYYKKRNDFSESHYKLGRTPAMFDIDVMAGEWLELSENRGTKENATYIEYECLKFDKDDNQFNSDRIKWLALFELKYMAGDYLKSNLRNNTEMNPGTPLWAVFMLAKKLKCRFFLVIATEGNSPFHFFEYCHQTNKRLPHKTMHFDYLIDDPELIKNFWKNELQLI